MSGPLVVLRPQRNHVPFSSGAPATLTNVIEYTRTSVVQLSEPASLLHTPHPSVTHGQQPIVTSESAGQDIFLEQPVREGPDVQSAVAFANLLIVRDALGRNLRDAWTDLHEVPIVGDIELEHGHI